MTSDWVHVGFAARADPDPNATATAVATFEKLLMR
jgi:hypothetical protein